jgi:hypothetical protein
MRSLVRLLLAAVVVATGPILSACSSLDSFDPSEWFDSKKKVAGDRKDVFPDGVPGVTSGVPPELVKGYREPEGGPLDPAKAAAEAAAGASPKKPPPQRTASKPKPKPKPADASARPASASPASATPTSGSAQQPPPPPAGSPWPAPQPPAPWPGSR